jgi:hypothetical protein
MKELTIKCYPAIDPAALLSEQRTMIINGYEVANEQWHLIINRLHQGFNPHLSAHWFRFTREDGHEKHYITNDPSQAKHLLGLCRSDRRWRYVSFWL